MIFHGLKAILIHNERTGGTSCKRYLSKFSKSKKNFSHKLPPLIERIVGDKIFKSYFKFTFVRNPWDRMVSVYHAYQQINWKGAVVDYVRSLTFEEYIRKPNDEILVPQWMKTIGVDKVYRFEAYAKGMKDVCKRLKVPYENFVKYKTKHEHYTKYYTPELRELVYQYFYIDIKRFGYKFGE